MSEVIHLKTPTGGKVTVTTAPVVTEREIAEERGNIIQTLHAAYLTLNDSMSEFQKQWDANPTMAFLDSAREGVMQGSSTWVSDQAELFDKKTWVELGGKIENFAGGCLDRMAAYSKQQYKDLEKEVNKHVAKPDRTLYNWAWWQKSIEDQVKGTVEEQTRRLCAVETGVRETATAIAATAEKARKIYKYRDAIMNLPLLIAAGDPKPIQAFVEIELMDIDKKLATAIRNDPNFAIVLEIIADNESALSYVSYVSLMIEAIPPNFYAYIGGKGAAYVVIEVVMLVITALLSAGAAAAARIATLVVRLATTSAKVAGAAKKLKHAKAAVDAFIRVLEDLMTAVNDLHALGAKLVKARSKGLTVRGNANTRLAAQKQSIRREKKCMVCGRTGHPSQRHRRGHVTYT
jgi:hypothetical protein